MHVFWTRIGDAPERIYHSLIDLRDDWRRWACTRTREILRPELPWEGADEPCVVSNIGGVDGCVNQLRDPYVFEHEHRVYLFYAGGGESAIGLAELLGL